MKFNEALGQSVRRIRGEQKLTLRDLAARSYVSMGHLSDIEHGKKEASSTFIDSLAQGLGVPTYELIVEAGSLMMQFEIPNSPEDLLDAHLKHGFALQT